MHRTRQLQQCQCTPPLHCSDNPKQPHNIHRHMSQQQLLTAQHTHHHQQPTTPHLPPHTPHLPPHTPHSFIQSLHPHAHIHSHHHNRSSPSPSHLSSRRRCCAGIFPGQLQLLLLTGQTSCNIVDHFFLCRKCQPCPPALTDLLINAPASKHEPGCQQKHAHIYHGRHE